MTEPTTHEVTFPLAWLRAMRLLAPKDDIREYMRGVAIAHGYLAASNGHYVGALRDDRFKDLPEVIIPNDAIDPILRIAKGYVDADVSVRWTPPLGESGTAVSTQGILTFGTVQQGFFAPTGRYLYIPNAFLPAPTEVKGYSQFQWSYLVLFEKVAEALGAPRKTPEKIHLTLNGESAARVRIPCAPNFDGVLMPLRGTFTEF